MILYNMYLLLSTCQYIQISHGDWDWTTGGDFLSSHLDEIVGNGLGTAKSQHMLETALAVDPCHNIQFFLGSDKPQKPPIFPSVAYTTLSYRETQWEREPLCKARRNRSSVLDMLTHPELDKIIVCAFHCRPCLVPLKGGAGPLHSWSWCCGRSQSVSCSSELLEKALLLPGEHYPSTTCHAFVESVSQINNLAKVKEIRNLLALLLAEHVWLNLGMLCLWNFRHGRVYTRNTKLHTQFNLHQSTEFPYRPS